MRTLYLIVILAVTVLIAANLSVSAQRAEPTEEQRTAVWDVKHSEIKDAFRDDDAAFDAITLTLDTLRGRRPTIARAVARDIARGLGVIGQARALDDNVIEDRKAFREFIKVVNRLPFSDADRKAIVDAAKLLDIVTEP